MKKSQRIRQIALTFGFLAMFAVSAAAEETRFGRYIGTLHNNLTGKTQYAKMDFVVSREDTENQLQLMAILTLFFGDFSSKEYVSYHFHDVKYNLLTGTLIFDQPDQEVTLVTKDFSNGSLIAALRSNLSGDIGDLNLKTGGSVSASSLDHRIGPLWGEYKSVCEGKEQTLQLATYRSSADTLRVGNPFAAYEIRGQLAEDVESLCPRELGRPCVMNQYEAGSYNFFEDKLVLFGKLNSLECSVRSSNALSCGSCEFIRVSDEAAASFKQNTPLTSGNALVIGEQDPGIDLSTINLSGTYQGYLHHEYLNQYQPASINLVTYQDGENQGQLHMSATANLYFGKAGSGETLSYRFGERSYNLLSKQFVFERADADVDAVLQVTSIGNGQVKGIWYSILFGRVGTFILSKSDQRERSTLPKGLKGFDSLAGSYESEDMELKVAVRQAQTPVNTENPFFPMTFGGYFYYKKGFAPRIKITGGSYDFYTGRLAFETGEGWRVATGSVLHSRPGFALKWPANGVAKVLQKHQPMLFLPE